MAAFNSDQFIETSIRSVLNQTLKDFELLIINDGSIDNTEAYINTFLDTRIQYLYQEHKGVSAARNLGLEKMSGDYFCFLDADDYMPPKSLEYRYNKFKKSEELEFIDGMIDFYNKDLKTKINFWKPSFSGNPLSQLLNLNDSCFFGLTWMIKRNKNINYRFNENVSHGEDLLFFIEITRHGGIYDYVDEVTLHYRKGHNSAMNDLRGLENGYHYIYNSIKNLKEASPDSVKNFKESAKKIIFKSYLGNYQLINAILSLFKKW